jgi:hypothetical protein
VLRVCVVLIAQRMKTKAAFENDRCSETRVTVRGFVLCCLSSVRFENESVCVVCGYLRACFYIGSIQFLSIFVNWNREPNQTTSVFNLFALVFDTNHNISFFFFSLDLFRSLIQLHYSDPLTHGETKLKTKLLIKNKVENKIVIYYKTKFETKSHKFFFNGEL